MQWCTPTQVLQKHLEERVFIAPPQVYELSRIMRLPNISSMRKFARSRQTLGTERWMPFMFTYDDGSLGVLPGDDYYPEEPRLITSSPVAEKEGSVDEANSNSTIYRNRIELRGTLGKTLCTIEPGCGHLAPITYPPSEDEVRQINQTVLRAKL